MPQAVSRLIELLMQRHSPSPQALFRQSTAPSVLLHYSGVKLGLKWRPVLKAITFVRDIAHYKTGCVKGGRVQLHPLDNQPSLLNSWFWLNCDYWRRHFECIIKYATLMEILCMGLQSYNMSTIKVLYRQSLNMFK